jgi:hypothetical protein
MVCGNVERKGIVIAKSCMIEIEIHLIRFNMFLGAGKVPSEIARKTLS